MGMYDQDMNDNVALQNLLAEEERKKQQGAVMNTVQPGMEEPQGKAPADVTASAMMPMAGTGIQASVDPTKTVIDQPAKKSAMDIYNDRLAAGDVSKDATQRERERMDAENATKASQPAASAPIDKSKWKIDNYSSPEYIATNYGHAPAGFDDAKWQNPNHQVPKYVAGRIMMEASDGTGVLKDPAKVKLAADNIIKAYPGTTFDGKDKITLPDGSVIDIIVGAGGGQSTIAWQPVLGPGGKPIPGEGAPGQGPAGMTGVGPSSTERINSLVPTDTSTYQTLLQKLQAIIGPQASDRNALMELMNRDVK